MSCRSVSVRTPVSKLNSSPGGCLPLAISERSLIDIDDWACIGKAKSVVRVSVLLRTIYDGGGGDHLRGGLAPGLLTTVKDKIPPLACDIIAPLCGAAPVEA